MDSQQLRPGAAQAGHEKDASGSPTARELPALRSRGGEDSPASGFVSRWLRQLALSHNQLIMDWTTGSNRLQTW